MKKFSNSPKTRLRQMRLLSPLEQRAVLRHITAGVPIHPWPYGMPSSPVPHVVVLGVSPGNSPPPSARGLRLRRSSPECPSFVDTPNFGCPDDPDGRHFWDKVRDLYIYLVKRHFPEATEDDAFRLSSHLNLGVGRAGAAGIAAVEKKIIKWVSELLYRKFPATILVGFGLTKILPLKNDVWNEGGLQLDWSNPDDTEPFEGYKFRFWRATRKDGKRMAVLLWPNHPSRHPFGGTASSPHWKAAKLCADKLLKRHNF